MVLTAHLPRESSLVSAVVGEPADWSVTDHLLAHAVDGINHVLYAYISAHAKHPPRAPQPVPRPVQRSRQVSVNNDPKPPQSTPNEVAAFFGKSSIHVAPEVSHG